MDLHLDEEDCALAAKARKGKGRKFHSKYESKNGKNQDMSKGKCFHNDDHGNFATKYPQKKKNKKVGGSPDGKALALKFELNFSSFACMVSSALGSVWYLDNKSSFHMTGDKELFSDLEEKDL